MGGSRYVRVDAGDVPDLGGHVHGGGGVQKQSAGEQYSHGRRARSAAYITRIYQLGVLVLRRRGAYMHSHEEEKRDNHQRGENAWSPVNTWRSGKEVGAKSRTKQCA